MDWSIYLRIRSSKLLNFFSPLFVRGERAERFRKLSNNIRAYDLSNGLPFENDSMDVVYHSHFLEHLDREVARQFLVEVKRILKPGGIHRIVVPDFELLCRYYIDHVDLCDADIEQHIDHDNYIAVLLEQSVRREVVSTSQQKPMRRYLENILLGDARKRGDTHQWMYDRISLSRILKHLGYQNVLVQTFDSSLIPNWNDYALDLDDQGNQYRGESLYVDAVK